MDDNYFKNRKQTGVHSKTDYPIAQELGLTDKDRLEEGIDHHLMSERIVRFMADHDLFDYHDSLDISIGGDGDNGEQMMYLMDAFFEMQDLMKGTNLIPGRKYIIDKDFHNSGIVELVRIHGKNFCTVKDPDTGSEWDTMCNRLSPYKK